MNTFVETEALLRLAITLSKTRVKKIAEECGIKANTLYKWKTTDVHLSPQKADALLAKLDLHLQIISHLYYQAQTFLFLYQFLPDKVSYLLHQAIYLLYSIRN